MSHKNVQRVVIIGGGFAGLECARNLANKPGFEVTLLDRTNHHLFQPLLYQVATATLAAPDVARSLRGILEKAKNVTVFMDNVCGIDSDSKKVTGESGKEYPYDTLVVAAGAKTGYFGNNHWGEHTIGLKSLSDAYSVRKKVLENLEAAERTDDPAERQRLMTIVIVGGGPTGVELAGAFVELIKRSMHRNFRRLDVHDIKVLLVEAGPRVLPPYKETNSAYAQKRLEKIGVEVRTSTMVSDIQANKIITKDEEIECGAILWAAGIEAEGITAHLPCERNRAGKVTPEADLSLPGHPNIFVAGDLVFMKDIADKPVPGVAPAASQMGRHIAKLLLKESKSGGNAVRPGFKYLDKGSMAIIGRSQAVVEFGKMKLTGFIAWLAWLFIHIAFLVDYRSKVAVLLQWAWAYISDAPGARVFGYQRK
ncbi:NAD(P)/FAD-dependent oxidoreductase [Verrucomicrobiaceae bacterium 5K15]|uniref:NADH:ubiquinone reductase (non-electrogenic) n=1 Tax=Oceaniferula flava TaxID=2800421 RepID=A0AAE2SD31_9BACT|nr:NAD(P)/FAD-dependent oxidoreductase [Oceaniferula flavus]MBK1854076.1 NAD(P)/FAD-dependent oxidoreductase [Oceaniferula flavus]MBM1135382.1 NAD(P)/FAD-dependent oxidoreductase [Oceaniferula flavus]